MSIKIMDGCDLYGVNTDFAKRGWIVSATPPTPVTTGGYNGGGYINMTQGTHLAINNGVTNYVKMTGWVRLPLIEASNTIFAIVDNAGAGSSAPATIDYHGALAVLSDGSVEIRGDSNGLKHVTAAGKLTANTLHFIEALFLRGSSGSCDLYIDGTLAGSVTADFHEGTLGMNCYIMSTAGEAHFDDVTIDIGAASPALYGVSEILTQLPNADTAQADYVGSYTDIDDPIGGSDGDTTTVTSATVNADSRFGFTDLPETVGDILAVNHVVEHRKSDAGSRGVTPYVQSGATRSDSTEHLAAETYSFAQQLLIVDPNTSVAWTKAGVDALEAGFKLTT